MDPPHVVILPFPAQGHIKPMLILAELLSRAAFTISFVNSEHNHRRIDKSAILRRCPGIQFLSVPDGLPPDHPRAGLQAVDLFLTTPVVVAPIFKNLIAAMTPPPACIISDGMMSFAIDVAAELGIPAITFRTYSATCTWLTLHLEKLIKDGEIPVVEGRDDMDRLIPDIPGLENIIRPRDLPSPCKLHPQNPIIQFYISQTLKMTKASGLILNTFEELEAPIISHLESVFPAVYAIGPLHTAVKNLDQSVPHDSDSDSYSSSSLIEMDKSCLDWLDSQPSNSVVYVSFGSLVVLTWDQFMEFWYGLVNSGKPFLWAIRPKSISDDNGLCDVPDEMKVGLESGRVVGWAPQEDVLAHEAVGCFLTHCGWNSTLESISFGKPMICWPKFAEQQSNRRCVGAIWKVGLDTNDVCHRSTVEEIVRDLMDGGNEEIVKTADEIGRLARESVREGGSSHRNMKKLIEDIKLMQASKNESKH